MDTGLVEIVRRLLDRQITSIQIQGEAGSSVQLFPEATAQGLFVDGGMDAHGRSPAGVLLSTACSEGNTAALYPIPTRTASHRPAGLRTVWWRRC